MSQDKISILNPTCSDIMQHSSMTCNSGRTIRLLFSLSSGLRDQRINIIYVKYHLITHPLSVPLFISVVLLKVMRDQMVSATR